MQSEMKLALPSSSSRWSGCSATCRTSSSITPKPRAGSPNTMASPSKATYTRPKSTSQSSRSVAPFDLPLLLLLLLLLLSLPPSTVQRQTRPLVYLHHIRTPVCLFHLCPCPCPPTTGGISLCFTSFTSRPSSHLSLALPPLIVFLSTLCMPTISTRGAGH